MLTAIILIPLEFLQFVFRLFCQQLLFFPHVTKSYQVY